MHFFVRIDTINYRPENFCPRFIELVFSERDLAVSKAMGNLY